MNSPQTTISGFKAVTNTFIRVLPIGIYAGLVLMTVIFQNIEAYYLLIGLIANDFISFGYQQIFEPAKNPRCAYVKSSNDESLLVTPHTQILGFIFGFAVRYLYIKDKYFALKSGGLIMLLLVTMWSRVDVGCMTFVDALYSSVIGILLGSVYFELIKDNLGFVTDEPKEEEEKNDIFS